MAQCGKYVIDRENQRIRLPKLDGFIEGTSNIQQLSTLKPAGLPNIIGRLYGDRINSCEFNGLIWDAGAYYIPKLDASRSSPVYGRSQKGSTTSNYCFNLY